MSNLIGNGMTIEDLYQNLLRDNEKQTQLITLKIEEKVKEFQDRVDEVNERVDLMQQKCRAFEKNYVAIISLFLI